MRMGQVKDIVCDALRRKYGFSPRKRSISILSVNRAYLSNDTAIWCRVAEVFARDGRVLRSPYRYYEVCNDGLTVQSADRFGNIINDGYGTDCEFTQLYGGK